MTVGRDRATRRDRGRTTGEAMPLHTRTPTARRALVPSAVLAALLLGACGDGGSTGDAMPGGVPNAGAPDAAPLPVGARPGESPVPARPGAGTPRPPPPSDDGAVPLELDADPSMLDEAGITALGDGAERDETRGGGRLTARVFESEVGTELDVAEGLVALVELFDESLILPRDLAVNVIDCGTANAFYVPDATGAGFPGPNIFLCNELVRAFVDFYNADPESVFLASAFVFVHELGHALIDLLDLPVLGIEESYVDGVAAVFAGEGGMAEASLVAGFFFLAQPDSPWFDTHRVGRQRFGDLACWALGAEPALANDPEVRDIADQLVASGRDCVAAYRQQLDGLTQVLDPHVRGDLGAAFASVERPGGLTTGGEGGAVALSDGADGAGAGIELWDISNPNGDVLFAVLLGDGPDAGAYVLDFRGDAFDRGPACFRLALMPFPLERFTTDAANTLLLDGQPVGVPITGADLPSAPFCDDAPTASAAAALLPRR